MPPTHSSYHSQCALSKAQIRSYLCPAQDLSVLPITLRIKFKCFNMTLYDGAHLPLHPLSPSSLCPSMSSFSGLSGPQTGSPSPECTILEDSFFPSLLAVFPLSFRSQRGCHFLWEVFSDTHLHASLQALSTTTLQSYHMT